MGMYGLNGNLLSESIPIREPLTRVDAQSPLRPWPGFEPMHLGIPRPPKCKQPKALWRGHMD